MPNLSDEQKVQAATEAQAKTQAALQSVQQQAQELARQVRSDLEVMMPQRGQVQNEAGEQVHAQPRDSNDPASVDEMGQRHLDRDLERLDTAAQQLDNTNREALTNQERQHVEKLADGLRDIWNGSEQLDSARRQLDRDIGRLREAVEQPWDQHASDAQVEQRIQQEQRLDTLQRAQAVADAADSLLQDMQHMAVSCVERQEVGKPNPDPRPDASQTMGESATAAARGPEGQRFDWMHMLARAFGGADTSRDLITGNREVHKDMTALERSARALAENAKVELEITAAHAAVRHSDDTKARNGFELRMQMWVSDKNEPADRAADPTVDIRLDLRASARDPSLKPVFDQLRQLNDDLQQGRSPEETVQQLAQFIEQHQQSVSDEEDRLRRIWVESGGEGDLPDD